MGTGRVQTAGRRSEGEREGRWVYSEGVGLRRHWCSRNVSRPNCVLVGICLGAGRQSLRGNYGDMRSLTWSLFEGDWQKSVRVMNRSTNCPRVSVPSP